MNQASYEMQVAALLGMHSSTPANSPDGPLHSMLWDWFSSFLELHIERAITAKSTSRNGGRRRQEPDEPGFKSKFSSAILGSCGTTAFVVNTFRSRVSSVSALRTGQGQRCYMAWVALHEPEPAAALWDVFKKHLLDSHCIYKPLTTHVPF